MASLVRAVGFDYTGLARELQVSPNKMVFIDDRAAALAGLEVLGIQTIRFNGLVRLKSDLLEMGWIKVADTH